MSLLPITEFAGRRYVTADRSRKIGTYFTAGEFNRSGLAAWLVSDVLVRGLDAVRAALGAPVTIVTGYVSSGAHSSGTGAVFTAARDVGMIAAAALRVFPYVEINGQNVRVHLGFSGFRVTDPSRIGYTAALVDALRARGFSTSLVPPPGASRPSEAEASFVQRWAGNALGILNASPGGATVTNPLTGAVDKAGQALSGAASAVANSTAGRAVGDALGGIGDLGVALSNALGGGGSFLRALSEGNLGSLNLKTALVGVGSVYVLVKVAKWSGPPRRRASTRAPRPSAAPRQQVVTEVLDRSTGEILSTSKRTR